MSVLDVGHFYLHVGDIMQSGQFTFNDTTLEVHPTQDDKQWFMTVEEVARAYGVGNRAIRQTLERHAEEIRYGIERGEQVVPTLGGNQSSIIIYREGVIKLGFFIHGERAKAFRQFATELVIQHLDQSSNNSPKGYEQLLSKIEGVEANLSQKLDQLNCVAETVFGDERKEIQDLVAAVAKMYEVDGRTVWGWIQTECDVSSYKKQNLKVKNFLRNKLGKGIKGIVKEKGAE